MKNSRQLIWSAIRFGAKIKIFIYYFLYITVIELIL